MMDRGFIGTLTAAADLLQSADPFAFSKEKCNLPIHGSSVFRNRLSISGALITMFF